MILEQILTAIDTVRDVLALDVSTGHALDGSLCASMTGIRTLYDLCGKAITEEAEAFQRSIWPDVVTEDSDDANS
jgi:hypothetical protein